MKANFYTKKQTTYFLNKYAAKSWKEISVFLEALAWAGELLNLANLRRVSDMKIECTAGFGKFIDIKPFISGLGAVL